MPRRRARLAPVVGLLLIINAAGTSRAGETMEVPSTVETDGVPPIPKIVGESLDQFRFRSNSVFEGWYPGRREVLCRAYGPRGTRQLYRVADWSSPRRPRTAGMPDLEFLGDLFEANSRSRADESREPVTDFREAVAWASPHRRKPLAVCAVDRGGDERYQFYLLDLKEPATFPIRFAAPITRGRARNIGTCWSNSGVLLAMSSDARTGLDVDTYVIDPLRPWSWRRLTGGPGWWVPSSWSPDDRRLAVVEYRGAREDSRVHLIEPATGRDEVVFEPPPGGRAITHHVRWARDGSALYWLTDLDSEFYRLARYDFATRATTTLTGDLPGDVEDFEISGDGRSIVLVANEDGYSRLHLLDGPTGRYHVPPTLARGQISQIIFRGTSREFGFQWSCTQAPDGIFSFDLSTAIRTEWVKPRRDNWAFGRADEPESIRYPSFDGRLIPAFVRRPSTPFEGPPYPVLIDLHGGPSSQSRPDFSAFDAALLHDEGVAIIKPNVRGSTGYGKTFESLDDGRRREDAVKDVGALLDWIATQPDLDRTRVAVTGGSYGGFLALASLVRYGDRLVAGIDSVGISSFETFLRDADPPNREGWRREFGDERDPETLAFLREISPLTHAAEIRRPLLVIHGVNDPRVKVAEADRIVAAVRRNGVPVWSLRFRDEGHGVVRAGHAYYEQAVQAYFLQWYLKSNNPTYPAPAEDPDS